MPNEEQLLIEAARTLNRAHEKIESEMQRFTDQGELRQYDQMPSWNEYAAAKSKLSQAVHAIGTA